MQDQDGQNNNKNNNTKIIYDLHMNWENDLLLKLTDYLLSNYYTDYTKNNC